MESSLNLQHAMKTIRVGIAVLLAFAVLAFGAVDPWAGAGLEVGAAVLFLIWGGLAIRRREVEIHGNWLYLPLFGLGGFALAQQALGLSVYTYATKVEFLRWVTYFVIFFLTVESFRTVAERKNLLWFLLSLGFVVSLFGIAQHLTSNGKLYWFVVLQQGGMPFGPFVNHSHFAGFVELIVPLGIATLIYGAVPREKLGVPVLFTVILIGALVLSASRAGIASFIFEFAILGILLLIQKQRRRQLLNVGGVILVAAVLVGWLGVGGTTQRFQALFNEDVSHDRRVSMGRDTWRIFLQDPWTGTGLGTFRTVYPRYETSYDGLTLDHTHNDYLELLAELGVVGGLCALAFIALLLWQGLSNSRSARNPFERSLCAGALVGCAGLLLHSLVDFNFHVPSNALLFFVLAALTTSHPHESMEGCRLPA